MFSKPMRRRRRGGGRIERREKRGRGRRGRTVISTVRGDTG